MLLTIIQTRFEIKRLERDFKDTRKVLEINLIEKYVIKYLPDDVIKKEKEYIFNYSCVVFGLWIFEIIVMFIYVFL